MVELLVQLHRAAQVYRDFVTHAATLAGPTDRLGLFGYRTGVLESEVIKPMILCLLDPEQPPLPKEQITKSLDVLESWMVRRMLVRATTKSYSQIVPELVRLMRGPERLRAGDVIEDYLAGQSSESRYWPDDAELKTELDSLPVYRRLSRARLRMVLEAIEDYRRGWQGEGEGLGGERVARGKFAIEHILPRKWQTHWPLAEGGSETGRERLMHTLGNLTLLTGPLNSRVSNGPWTGAAGKREALRAHDVLLLNRDIESQGGDEWSDDAIRARTTTLAEFICNIWRVPLGHRVKHGPTPRKVFSVELVDLLAADVLVPGTQLVPRQKKFAERVATLLSDGRIEVDGIAFSYPTEAATKIAGRQMGGWWFFLVDPVSRRSLRDVRNDYVSAMSLDTHDDEVDGDEDDD
jgi:hypothetical protein